MPNESTLATSNQTYFADEKIEIPETPNVSLNIFIFIVLEIEVLLIL